EPAAGRQALRATWAQGPSAPVVLVGRASGGGKESCERAAGFRARAERTPGTAGIAVRASAAPEAGRRWNVRPEARVPLVGPFDNRDGLGPCTTVSMLRSHPLFGPTLVATGDLLALLVAWLAVQWLAPPAFPAVLLLPLAFVHQIVLSGHGLPSRLRSIRPRVLLRPR